jgi:hypothetical protein
MRSHSRVGRSLRALLAGCAICTLLATATAAHPPVYKDAERAGAAHGLPPLPPEVMAYPVCCDGAAQGYHRPVNGGPGYVGSVRGLGRPSYDGLWPPPGYGSYRELPTD